MPVPPPPGDPELPQAAPSSQIASSPVPGPPPDDPTPDDPTPDDPTPPSRPRRTWLFATAAAAMVLGTATAGYAAWGRPDDFAEAHPTVHGLRIWTGLLVAAAVAWLLVEPLRRRRDGAGTGARLVTVIGGAGLAAAVTAWAVTGAANQASKGFLGPTSVVAALGGAVVFLGAVALIPQRTSSVRIRPVLVSGLATAVVVAALTAGALWAAPRVGLHSTTASATTNRSAPGSVSGVAWRTAMPTRVRDVQVAGPGVVALLSDGAAGVDGQTGRVRWTLRRTGAVATTMTLTADRRTMLLQWTAGRYGGTQLVFLDPMTGRVRHTSSSSRSSLFGLGLAVPLSTTTYVGVNQADPSYGGDDGPTIVTGRDPRTGRTQWRYQVPTSCRLDDTLKTARFTDTVVVAMLCRSGDVVDTARFVGFRSGASPVWQRTVAVQQDLRDRAVYFGLHTGRDGSYYEVTLSSTTATGSIQRFGLDAHSGTVQDYVELPFGDLAPGRSELSGTTSRGVTSVATASGPVIGRVANSRCSQLRQTIYTTQAIGCLSVEDAATYRRTGAVTIRVEGYDGTRRSVHVALGGSLQSTGFTEARTLLAAPGAWVAWSGDAPAAGTAAYLVGLR